MDHICVHNNRLWGTAQNGEYLYASKLGDCLNFNSFQGLGDDSWYGMVGTAGGFTGNLRPPLPLWRPLKRDCIHHIYGDGPQNFSIPKQTMGGCLDSRSIAELGGVLYFLSAAGFRPMQAESPTASAHSWTRPIYPVPRARTAAGTTPPHTGLTGLVMYWPLIRSTASGTGRTIPRIWALSVTPDGSICRLRPGGSGEFSAGEAAFDWSFTTQRLTYGAMEHKGGLPASGFGWTRSREPGF